MKDGNDGQRQNRRNGKNNPSQHGKTKPDDKPMDGPNPDHTPTGAQSQDNSPTGAQSQDNRPTGTPNPENRPKESNGNDGQKQNRMNGKYNQSQHGKTKPDDKQMDGPNPDHTPTGA